MPLADAAVFLFTLAAAAAFRYCRFIFSCFCLFFRAAFDAITRHTARLLLRHDVLLPLELLLFFRYACQAADADAAPLRAFFSRYARCLRRYFYAVYVCAMLMAHARY